MINLLLKRTISLWLSLWWRVFPFVSSNWRLTEMNRWQWSY